MQPLWPPSSMPAVPDSSSRSLNPNPPLLPTSAEPVTPTPEREPATAVAAAAAVKAMALAVHPQHAAAGLVFGGAFNDDDADGDADGDVVLGGVNKALTLAALSGFVEGGGAKRFQEVSIDLSNACRASASWSLRLAGGRKDQGGNDDEEGEELLPPSQLVDHVWPESTLEAPVGSGAGSAAAEGKGGAKGHAPLARTNSSRLQPRRSITCVTMEGNVHGVTLASWPSTMKRLEFGPRFNSAVEGMSLPEGLKVVRFGVQFNQSVSRVRWPETLRELVFGNDFNQPVSGMDLPAGIRRLDFGGRFNFAISAVDFPEELRELRFGHG